MKIVKIYCLYSIYFKIALAESFYHLASQPAFMSVWSLTVHYSGGCILARHTHAHTHACTHARTHVRTHARTHTHMYTGWKQLTLFCQSGGA